MGWGPRYDEWLPTVSGRMARHRTQVKQIEDGQLDSNFRGALQHERNFIVTEMVNDGNSLFRAASMSLYGSDEHHQLVRQACCKWMVPSSPPLLVCCCRCCAHLWPRILFQQFYEHYDSVRDVAQGRKLGFASMVMGDFRSYLTRMRKEGSEGGELELIALSELYFRPFHVYSTQCRAVPTKYIPSFKDAKSPKPKPSENVPLLLSFHLSGHFNSCTILGEEWELMPDAPGVHEEEYVPHVDGQGEGEEEKEE